MSIASECIVSCHTSHEALQRQLTKAVNTAPPLDQSKLNELAFMIYDLVSTGNYGKGPYEITMCAGDKSFALTLTTVRS